MSKIEVKGERYELCTVSGSTGLYEFKFEPLHNSVVTNKVAEDLARKRKHCASLEGPIIFNYPNIGLLMKLFSEKLEKNPRFSTTALLDVIIQDCARRDNCVFRLDLTEFMKKRGLTDRTSAEEQVMADLEILNNVEVKIGKMTYFLVGFFSGLDNGKITVSIFPAFLQICKESYMMIPDEYYKVKERLNPHKGYFIRKVALHKFFNCGKANEDTISVASILKSAPSFNYESWSNRNNFTIQLKKPFERDMNSIESFDWEYRDGEPKTWEEFSQSMILIHWKCEPKEWQMLRERHARNTALAFTDSGRKRKKSPVKKTK